MLRAVLALVVSVVAFSPVFAGELKITDLEEGAGAEIVKGVETTVHYTGWLMDGTKFDSSLDRGTPFKFTPGAHRVIPGWEKGVLGMKVGGKRQLIIPPELAYGKRGAGGVIPPNATLKFEISVLAAEQPKFQNIDNAELRQLRAAGVRLIDIRLPEEWKQTGVVEGSILMTFFDKKGRVNPEFMEEFTKLVGKKDKIILICRTGSRTGVVSQFLAQKAGYEGIINVSRGITHWIAEGNPVVKAEMPKTCWLC
ncbi:MAG: FKBP-type peptidyl-prolyl cis-trans isomerase [Hyphomicrobiales bacterium]|nr:FKBP-type peptidyl-prolyl cis-trans isomerase [Hyphomicrobiales bacterium]